LAFIKTNTSIGWLIWSAVISSTSDVIRLGPIAESRIEELTSFWPGEFQIMDQQNHQIVEKIILVRPTAIRV